MLELYNSRVAEATLKRYLSTFPAVGVTGPRQSGKSTLLQNMLKDYEYVTFDENRHRLAFEEDPEGFINQFTSNVIFDEVQYVPEIFNILKVRIDQDRSNYGKYVLTGSSQFSFLQKASESLAGRIGLMSLLPFQYAEMPAHCRQESVYQGAYPELVLRQYAESGLWYSSYIDTYLSKDVRPITEIVNMRDFHRLIQLLAASVTTTLDMSSLARDIGVSVPTIKRWVSVLEASYIIFLLPPFYENYGKRIVKSPKVYFYDTGLVSYLTGITSYEQYNKGPLAGGLFENYIISDILKQQKHTASHAQLYYLRTQDQAEVDLILDEKSQLTFIEIKKGATYHPKMSSALRKYGDGHRQVLLYNGVTGQDRGVELINYHDFFNQNV